MIWDAFRNVPSDIMRYMALSASMDDADANRKLRDQQLADMQRKNEATQAVGEILKQGPQMISQQIKTPNQSYVSPENQETMEMAGYAPKFDADPYAVTTTQRPEAMHEMLQRAGQAVMAKDAGTGLAMIKEGRAQLDDQLSQIVKMAKVSPDAAVRMFNENPALGGMFGPMRKIGEDGEWTMFLNDSLGVYRLNKKTGQYTKEEAGPGRKVDYWEHMQRAVVEGNPESRAILSEDERRKTAEKLAEYHGKKAAEAPEKQWKSDLDVAKTKADWIAKEKRSNLRYGFAKPEEKARIDKELEEKADRMFPAYRGGEGGQPTVKQDYDLRLPDGTTTPYKWEGTRPPTKKEQQIMMNEAAKNVIATQQADKNGEGQASPSKPTTIKQKTDAAKKGNVPKGTLTPQHLEEAKKVIGGDLKDPAVVKKIQDYLWNKLVAGDI